MGETVFDGAAISRADREFLARLDEHPLRRNPLYGTPCPPVPALNDEAERKAFFAQVMAWMLANYAYCKNANMGKGAVVSLVDGGMVSLAALRSEMQPYALVSEGPRGGTQITSVVDAWMIQPRRERIDGLQTRFDKPRPTFEEDGYVFFNRYRPPAHPTSGGEIETFNAFFAHLFPEKAEREWLWNYFTHKARKPWVPMVAVIMVAEEFGSGRGTLFNIFEFVFGKDYVVPCAFDELTGKSSAARFNHRMASALFIVVNEAVAEDGHQQAQRRIAYDALKNVIEPSQAARRRFEQKHQHVYTQQAAMTVIIATNYRDIIKLPRDDRRCGVVRCGPKMTAIQRTEIRDWMAIPENIGALYRAFLATPAAPLEVFDPYGDPPPFTGRLEMIRMGVTRLEEAYAAAIDALDGFPLFTMTQAKRLIGYFGNYTSGDWVDKALHTIAKHAYRLHGRDAHPTPRAERTRLRAHRG
jgi:uncharacterized protein DUF5906